MNTHTGMLSHIVYFGLCQTLPNLDIGALAFHTNKLFRKTAAMTDSLAKQNKKTVQEELLASDKI